eukprot:882280-Amphidinium_carterae.1
MGREVGGTTTTEVAGCSYGRIIGCHYPQPFKPQVGSYRYRGGRRQTDDVTQTTHRHSVCGRGKAVGHGPHIA